MHAQLAQSKQSRANEGTEALGAASAGLREAVASLPRAVTSSGAARAALAAPLAAASSELEVLARVLAGACASRQARPNTQP